MAALVVQHQVTYVTQPHQQKNLCPQFHHAASIFSTLILSVELPKKKRKGNTIKKSTAVSTLPFSFSSTSHKPQDAPRHSLQGIISALAGETPSAHYLLLQNLSLKADMPSLREDTTG